jgi:alkylation response protein AidB-like acyl-CoA dehydrogenase
MTADSEVFREQFIRFIVDFMPSGWKGQSGLAQSELASFRARWRTAMAETGYLAPEWPVEFGGCGVGVLEASAMAEECARFGLPRYPSVNDRIGVELLGPTLLKWGTRQQKDQFLKQTVSGEIRWAQAYSEPGAGSDLFNLATKAELVGDQWVVRGQKVWQTGALQANWMFVLARTDPAADRPRDGLSFLLVPVDQERVETRGICNLAGEVEFAEVFFDDAVTPATNIVGKPGEGARVALSLLEFERGAGIASDAAAAMTELARLSELIEERGLQGDAALREEIGGCWASVYAMRSFGQQVLESAHSGEVSGAESSIIKLLGSEYRRRVTRLALRALGTHGMTMSGAEPVEMLDPQPRDVPATSSRAWTADYFHALAGTIYGGTSEIQRNVIAERLLGLPRQATRNRAMGR